MAAKSGLGAMAFRRSGEGALRRGLPEPVEVDKQDFTLRTRCLLGGSNVRLININNNSYGNDNNNNVVGLFPNKDLRFI